MDVEIRTIAPEELEAYTEALETSFSGRITPDELERDREVAETDRHHAAFEDGRIVGGAAACTYRLTVPGARAVEAAGITGVGVLPSHRRRGINTALMRAQLDDVRDRGEVVALLYASEATIYGRYGYGLASFLGEFEMDVERAGFVPGFVATGRVTLLSHDDALPRMRPVYDTAAAERPGMIALDDPWFGWRFAELERDKERPFFYALHETEAGDADAYAVYQVKHEWPNSIPRLELSVRELMATSSQAEAEMWRYVFDIDLLGTVNAWNRPADDMLLRRLAEPRRLRFSLKDGLWARLVNVPEALASRGYAADGSLIIEVGDAFCPWNEARYVLETSDGESACTPTSAEPDIRCTVNELGAVYLGGSTFGQLAAAGRVDAPRSEALARADAMFASGPAPWCSFMF